jgi:ATP synthase protein I
MTRGLIARRWGHLYTTRALRMGARVIPPKAPFRTTISDLGARVGIMERGVPLAFRIVAVQGVLATMLTMMFLLLGRAHAVSALVAGIVVIAPNVAFAWRITRLDGGAADALGSARRLVGSGMAKVLATIGLLVVAFASFRPEPVAFFATMIVVQAAYWLAPLLVRGA